MTSKRENLDSAVARATGTAMALAEDRFADIDQLLCQPPIAVHSAQTIAPNEPTERNAPIKKSDLLRKKMTVMLMDSDWTVFRTRCLHERTTGQDLLERLVKEYLSK